MAEEYRTSEQREFVRIEQERLDAELARQLAASEGQPMGHPPAARDGASIHHAGGWGGEGAIPNTTDPSWGRDYHEAAPQGYQQLPAGRQPSPVQLPLVEHFFCCISLRCGVLIVAACDAVSAIFQTLGALLVLTLPELVMAAEDETLMVGDDLEARARRFLEREMRARLFLSIMMSVFAIRGFRSVQSVDVQGLREYLNWKVLDTAIFAIMGVALHRLWWDGCGYLPQDSCWDLRYTFVTSTLLSLLLPIYCTWAIWSLLNVLKFGDDEAMIVAGFVPQNQRGDQHALGLGGSLVSPRFRGSPPPQPAGVSTAVTETKGTPRMTYMA